MMSLTSYLEVKIIGVRSSIRNNYQNVIFDRLFISLNDKINTRIKEDTSLMLFLFFYTYLTSNNKINRRGTLSMVFLQDNNEFECSIFQQTLNTFGIEDTRIALQINPTVFTTRKYYEITHIRYTRYSTALSSTPIL